MNGSNGTNGNGNGNGRLTVWMLGIGSTLLTGLLSAGVTNTMSKLSTHGEKIAVIEAQIQDTREQLHLINRKLDQINDHQK
jgi:hypothetical protein